MSRKLKKFDDCCGLGQSNPYIYNLKYSLYSIGDKLAQR